MSQSKLTEKLTAGQKARIAAKKRGRLQISAVLPVIAAAAAEAANQGLFSVDITLSDPWFLDKTNQRDLRRFLKQQELYGVNPRIQDDKFVLSVSWGDFPPEESLFSAKPVVLRKPVILVLNATSRCGMSALENFQEYTDLYEIRGTSRSDPKPEVAAKVPYVKWLKTDLSAQSLLAVTKGVDKVFYVLPAVQNRTELAKYVADACAANNVSYIVHISALGANNRAILFHNQGRDAEELFEKSGVPVTHLRCGAFHENVFISLQSIKSQGLLVQPWGNGATATLSASDIGRAATRLLTRIGAEGVAVELSGPEVLTGAQQAEILSQVLGRTITYQSPDLQEWSAQLKSYGVEDWLVQGLTELYGLVQKGLAASKSPDGEKLLGKMTTFKEFIEQNKAAFN